MPEGIPSSEPRTAPTPCQRSGPATSRSKTIFAVHPIEILRQDSTSPRPWLTHLNFGAYHLRLAFISGAAPGSRRRILEVMLWIRRS
jgi:hypothetical protein